MNKRQKTVMSKLKPKVKAFGFSKKELQSIAAQIADNLESEEEASDEDVNAEIDKAIEAVLPFLKLGQSYANRVINDSKNVNENEEDDEDDEEDEESVTKSKSKKSPKTKKEKSDEEPAWFKAYRETMEKQISELKGERIADTRKARLEKLLKDTGKFGERKIRDYARMTFKDDEAFDEFLSEVEEDLKSENQDRANKGLEKLGAPATGGGSKKKDEKKEILTEDEIKELAKN